MRTLYESLLDADFDISDDVVTWSVWDCIPNSGDVKCYWTQGNSGLIESPDDVSSRWWIDANNVREDIDKVIGRIGYFGSGEYELIDSVDDISTRYKSWFTEHVANDVGKYILSNAPGSVSVEVSMGQYEIPHRWPGLILSINDSPVFETYFPKFKVRGPSKRNV